MFFLCHWHQPLTVDLVSGAAGVAERLKERFGGFGATLGSQADLEEIWLGWAGGRIDICGLEWTSWGNLC